MIKVTDNLSSSLPQATSGPAKFLRWDKWTDYYFAMSKLLDSIPVK